MFNTEDRPARLAMPREIVGKGLRFSLRHAPCAHICRYCLISESRKRSALPFSRFEQLVHRFYDWKQSANRDDLQIGVFVGPSYDYDIETLQGVARLRARRGAKFEILNLGGVRLRSGAVLIAWLEERRAAGIKGFHASLAGCGDTHDRWNGRAGDFDYQTTILRLAGERGMVRQEKLFLTQNTLPAFDRLLDILDGLPGEVSHRRRAHHGRHSRQVAGTDQSTATAEVRQLAVGARMDSGNARNRKPSAKTGTEDRCRRGKYRSAGKLVL
jgi:hypothetical protein